MHASSCSICRIATGERHPRCHSSILPRQVQRYKNDHGVNARRLVLPYSTLPFEACIVHAYIKQMQHAALCTPWSTPAQRAQPFREADDSSTCAERMAVWNLAFPLVGWQWASGACQVGGVCRQTVSMSVCVVRMF